MLWVALMNIMLAISQLKKMGGKERDCIAIAHHLKARGHSVEIVTMSTNATAITGCFSTRLVLPAITNRHGHARLPGPVSRTATIPRISFFFRLNVFPAQISSMRPTIRRLNAGPGPHAIAPAWRLKRAYSRDRHKPGFSF